MLLVSTNQALLWREWDGLFIVYQPFSAETHVFNQTTALILKCLEQGPRTMEGVKNNTEAALSLGQGQLGVEEFSFSVGRLEELGLIEYLDETLAIQ